MGSHNFICFSVFMILIIGCNQDECKNISLPDSCDTSQLIICDSSSFDLQEYIPRNDESSLYGLASAIKTVPGKGEIVWTANNRATYYGNDNYFLSLANYSDTAWVDLEYWAFLREVILIKFNPNIHGFQQVQPKSAYDQDTTLLYANYYKNADDIREATWDINDSQVSYISVSNYDTLTQIVEGEFDLYFELTSQGGDGAKHYAPKVRFKCGKFRARINE